ncbi:hypothetical protein A1O3_06072 [Capronia epimyces CBS 606.96]|uniref:Uncharacterized protein n=1 Tax=Capronia epimyces CBS 606.96 TaxID=1182542 RepID=W9YIY9_9EURO|nr:uncharacterized protein A1O3_06072 [Capronia epimyces CBS 606.96]EXJ82259.1 hypothetical protein A1O3_06072 [Capronia epimyces CBS 606.96]
MEATTATVASCGCSICEVFSNTSDDLSTAPHRKPLDAGRRMLHNLYDNGLNLTEEDENKVYEKLISLAEKDGLQDLKQTLEHLYESCD